MLLMNDNDLTVFLCHGHFVEPSWAAVTDASATAKVKQTFVMRTMR